MVLKRFRQMVLQKKQIRYCKIEEYSLQLVEILLQSGANNKSKE